MVFMLIVLKYKYKLLWSMLRIQKNVKTDFNSIGFFTCKSWLNQLTSEMLRLSWKGLNDISSK